MNFRSIKYYFLEAFANLFKNRLMTLASIVTVSSCTFIIILTYFIASNLDFFLEQFEKKLDVEVFFENYLTDEDITTLYEEISNINHINTIYYISYDEAIERFLDLLESAESENKDSNVAISNIAPGVLPRSFVITIDSTQYIEYVYAQLENFSDRGVYFPEIYSTVDIINSINTGIRIISITIILFLIINSVVIIVNTVKLTVNNRKIEINIMKYVGATDWFIKWPFLIEGALIGLIGSVLPLILGIISYSRLIDYINNNYESVVSIIDFRSGYSIFIVLIPLCIALGLTVGVIGSVNAVKKYLKV